MKLTEWVNDKAKMCNDSRKFYDYYESFLFKVLDLVVKYPSFPLLFQKRQ